MKTHSDQLDSLAPDLAAAQAELGNVIASETADTGKYAYHYADLAKIREVVTPVLTRHGLSVVQTVVPRREAFCCDRFVVLGMLRTVLLHKSGQWIAGEHPIGGDWGDPQRIGSAITYARRYGLAAICGVAQVDDDGAAASAPPSNGRGYHHQPARPALPAPREPGADDEFDEFGDDGPDLDTPAHERQHPAAENGRRSAPPPNGRARSNAEPRTGKQLFGWAKDRDELRWFTEFGRARRYPGQFNEWREDEVADAMHEYWAKRSQAAANGRH